MKINLEIKFKYKNWKLFFNLYDVMKTVVVAKIVHEALRAPWNFSSAHCLHHIMKVEK